MTPEAKIAYLNAHKPAFLDFLGGRVVGLSDCSCEFAFHVPLSYCHSGNIVQGGFVTAMLDAAMAHAVFGCDPGVTRLSSLEISTRYEGVTPGDEPLRVIGRIRKITRTIAFLDGEIVNAKGELCATAHSVAKISRRDAAAGSTGESRTSAD